MAGLTLPARIVCEYRVGRLRVVDLARNLGTSEERVRSALRRQNAILTMKESKRLLFARKVERDNRLKPGTLYRHVAALYRRGLGQKEIAARLGMSRRMSGVILARIGSKPRSVWCRSALFVDGDWRDSKSFARALRSLREDRGMTQKKLGEMAGISQSAVWKLELALNGPHWETAQRLAAALGVKLADLGLPSSARR